MIEPMFGEIPITRQCALLDLSRSSYYYISQRDGSYNLRIMNAIDEQYTQTPFYGVLRMTQSLRKDYGFDLNPKRVRRLMRLMGLEAIYPKPSLSKAISSHKKYPYLLRNLVIDHPDQVWATDITYIRMQHGFVYLVAVMDWYSRYVLSWEISTALDAVFCIEALRKALLISKPEIFNTDQGSQFTSKEFLAPLQENNIRISMDGRGRALDNIMVERLWRSVKYEEVYLQGYEKPSDAVRGLTSYFDFYNNKRLHQSLGYKPPVDFYPPAQKIKGGLASPRLSFAWAPLGSANHTLNKRTGQAIGMHQIQPHFLS
jgi:putative transposase